MKFFSSCSLNFQDLAENEARSLGITSVESTMGGIEFEATFSQAVNYCLSSFLSSRLMMRIGEANNIDNIDKLKKETQEIPFEDYFSPSDTILVTNTLHSCEFLKNSMLASQVVKDGICDRQRKIFGSRSYVDKDNPKFIVHVHIDKEKAQWYIDFSFPSLAKRRYRVQRTDVYLQEHTSSAVLLRSGVFKSDFKTIVDPFCGSGTLLIEAALRFANISPGLISKERYAFINYKDFDREWYDDFTSKIEQKNREGICHLRDRCSAKPFLFGFDMDENAINACIKNAEEAGVSEFISFRKKKIENLSIADIPSQEPGFLITDPPYDSRVKVENVSYIYKTLGDFIVNNLSGWNVSILSSDSELLRYVALSPQRTNTIMNGALKCTLAHYYVLSKEEREEQERKKLSREKEMIQAPLASEAVHIYNRLEKNLKGLSKFLKDNNITCYRLYDADMNEYSAAIDVYEDKGIVLQEYQKGKGVSYKDAERRLSHIKSALVKLYKISPSLIFEKKRLRQKGNNQYEKLSSSSQSYIVHENGHKFIVNFSDYLDTGLFLDHRSIRSFIKERSKDKRFLNLFCYTGSATVYALAGGALSAVSVDASQKYLDIARDNIKINFLDSSKAFFRKQDCFEYLKTLGRDEVFDIIFLDPPTFSNGKSKKTFDVQSDHTGLIKLCLEHLSGDGELIFSTNFRSFKLSEEIDRIADVKDITELTIDEDFRDKNIHKVFIINKKEQKTRSVKEIADEINNYSKKVISKYKSKSVVK